MNPRLQHDCVAVEHPEVSGFEHLDLLLVREALAAEESRLSKAEKEQLATADRRLLEQVAAFYAELARVIDLAAERQQRAVTPERWWWYLDVVRALSARPDPGLRLISRSTGLIL